MHLLIPQKSNEEDQTANDQTLKLWEMIMV